MKSILKTCTALTMVVAFGGQTMAQDMLQSLGAGEGEVSIVAWAGYIERGETDKAYDWVTKFEADSGCKVSVKTAATSDEMVALMNEGGFDLVTASGDASLRLIAGKRVQPVNIDLIKKVYLILHPEEGDIKTVKYRKDIPQHRLYFHEYAPPDKIKFSNRP